MNDSAERLIRLPEVISRSGLSRSQVYALMAIDGFPRAVKLTERSVRWRESEVAAWIDERIAARDKAAA